jgi:hypothetical protein
VVDAQGIACSTELIEQSELPTSPSGYNTDREGEQSSLRTVVRSATQTRALLGRGTPRRRLAKMMACGMMMVMMMLTCTSTKCMRVNVNVNAVLSFTCVLCT